MNWLWWTILSKRPQTEVIPPEYSTGEVGAVTSATVVIVFNEEINSGTSDYVTGVTIQVNAVSATISSGTLQAGNTTVRYVIATAADANDTVTWQYSDAVGDIADLAGNQLADVSAQTVTNNIGRHFWFDRKEDSGHLIHLFP